MSEGGANWQAIGLVLGLGLAWTSVHCAGMCGPLIAGLGIGRLGTGGAAGTGAPLRVIAQIASYQIGRSLAYATFGAGAGWSGEHVAASLQQGSLWVGSLLAAAFFIAALAKLGHPAVIRHLGDWFQRVPVPALSVLSVLPAGISARPIIAAGSIGIAMAFIPCGIVLWALGLAAASADPIQGAAVMVAVVVMSTPALVGSALLRSAPPMPIRWRERLRAWSGHWLPPASLAFSGAWILVMAISRSHGVTCHLPNPG